MLATTPRLFDTIPNDHFRLFDQAEPRGQRIVDLLEYKKREVAEATGVRQASIRYDKQMPPELRKRLFEWAIAINQVADFFQDEAKTKLWLKTPNPMLGGLAPRDMIRLGRFEKLMKFIRHALEENKR